MNDNNTEHEAQQGDGDLRAVEVDLGRVTCGGGGMGQVKLRSGPVV